MSSINEILKGNKAKAQQTLRNKLSSLAPAISTKFSGLKSISTDTSIQSITTATSTFNKSIISNTTVTSAVPFVKNSAKIHDMDPIMVFPQNIFESTYNLLIIFTIASMLLLIIYLGKIIKKI